MACMRSTQATFVARVVRETVGVDTLGKGGLGRVQDAVRRRVDGALSNVPANVSPWLLG